MILQDHLAALYDTSLESLFARLGDVSSGEAGGHFGQLSWVHFLFPAHYTKIFCKKMTSPYTVWEIKVDDIVKPPPDCFVKQVLVIGCSKNNAGTIVSVHHLYEVVYDPLDLPVLVRVVSLFSHDIKLIKQNNKFAYLNKLKYPAQVGSGLAQKGPCPKISLT